MTKVPSNLQKPSQRSTLLNLISWSLGVEDMRWSGRGGTFPVLQAGLVGASLHLAMLMDSWTTSPLNASFPSEEDGALGMTTCSR